MSAQQKLPQFIHGQPSMGLPFEKELVVDLFAGGGGASTGIARAYREPDVAVNHNPIALAVHRANHPTTAHYVADVFEVDPREATGGQPVPIIWASPDCRHHSKAKGGAPRDRGVRGLAWVVIRWLFVTKSRLLFLENVEEFCDWGPIDDDGQPIKSERGRTFKAFIAAISTGLQLTIWICRRSSRRSEGSCRWRLWCEGWATTLSGGSASRRAPARRHPDHPQAPVPSGAQRREADCLASAKAPQAASGETITVALGGRVHRLEQPRPHDLPRQTDG